ncbi:MAG TPA: phosphatase PAP2 family protein [Hyphomicrobiaceae bacterium]|nr:phosphatase PAP2 family protein [Hyphomicrobiaceae bacterium]
MANLDGMLSRLRALVAPVARVERVTLVTLIVAAAALFLFAKLADEVSEGSTRRFDEWLLLLLRTPGNLADPVGPRWFEEMARDVTALGGTAVLALMVLAVAGFLAMTRRSHAAVTVLVSVVGGILVSQGAKLAFARPRPELVPHGAEIYTASFPSGHAMMAAVVYLTLGALLARTQSGRSVKTYILAVAVILTLLVGATRVYLGVHWPTDVLAGWALGGTWALACWLVMLWLQARGEVEDEMAAPP